LWYSIFQAEIFLSLLAGFGVMGGDGIGEEGTGAVVYFVCSVSIQLQDKYIGCIDRLIN
jgi:hypothetical protein